MLLDYRCPGPRKTIIQFARRLLLRVVGYFLNKENWKKPQFWIYTALGLRAVTVLAREYGYSPFKKSLEGEHVFLTGAGGGLGRLLAVKLGRMGAKLSLSDINQAAIEETKQILINSGVSA